MEEMFAQCWGVNNLDFTKFNTSNVTDMSYMFTECSNISSLDLSSFDTSNVVNMEGMFSIGCMGFDYRPVVPKLTSLDISSFDTSKVVNMSNLFYGVAKVKSIDISNFNTTMVTNMSNMFKSYFGFVESQNPDSPSMMKPISYLENVKGLDGLNTSRVIDMSGMFYGCASLTSVNVGNWNISQVKDTSYMFDGCAKLSGEMTIDNFAVTNYTNMFNGCSSATNAEFWVKWKTPEDKELARRMVGTKNPSDHVYLWEPSSTLINGDLFHRKIKAIRDPYIKHIKFIVGHPNPDGIDFSEKQDKSITGIVNGETLTISCAGKIMANPYSATMFYYLTTLTDIDFDNFDTSNVTRMDDMFSTCINLETVSGVENWNVNKVTRMDGMFHKCQKLKNLNLSKWKTGKLVNVENMFQYCNNLGDLDLRGFDVSEVTSLMCIFEFCDSLKTVDITGWDTHNVEKMEVAFDGCLSLVEIKGLENIDTSKCFNYGKTFKDCGKLCGEITVKSSITIDDLSHIFYSFRCFENASTDINSRFVVKYINKESHGNAGQLVNEKSPNSNVFLYNEPCTLIDGPTFNNIIVNKEYSAIKNIVFEQDVPHNMSNYPYKDLSVAKDKSIVVYVDGDTLKVASDGKIMANELCTYMFRDNYRNELTLDSIKLVNFDTTNTTDLSGMFYMCTAQSITGLDNKNTSNVQYFGGMFENSKVKYLSLHGWDLSSCVDFEGMFIGSELEELDISNWNFNGSKSAGSLLCTTKLGKINVSNCKVNKQSSLCNIFGSARYLQEITGLNTWDTSGATSLDSMFADCYSLQTVDLSSFNTRNVTTMRQMFYYCFGLKNIIGLENIDTGNVFDYREMFYECSSLTATIIIDGDGKNCDLEAELGFGPYELTHHALRNCSTEPGSKFTVQYRKESAKTMAEYFSKSSPSTANSNIELKYIGEGPEPIYVKEETTSNILGTFKSAFNPNKSATPKPTTQSKTVNITLINGPSAVYQKQVIQTKAGKIGDLPKPDLNPKYAGQFGGYYYDQNCTISVKPNDIVTQDIELYAKW